MCMYSGEACSLCSRAPCPVPCTLWQDRPVDPRHHPEMASHYEAKKIGGTHGGSDYAAAVLSATSGLRSSQLHRPYSKSRAGNARFPSTLVARGEGPPGFTLGFSAQHTSSFLGGTVSAAARLRAPATAARCDEKQRLSLPAQASSHCVCPALPLLSSPVRSTPHDRRSPGSSPTTSSSSRARRSQASSTHTSGKNRCRTRHPAARRC